MSMYSTDAANYYSNTYGTTATTAATNGTVNYDVMRQMFVAAAPWNSINKVEKKQSPKSFYAELTIETKDWLKDTI